MLIEIKRRYDNHILYTAEAADLKEAVQKAVETRANLTRANLTDANLTDANLTRANLTDANLTDANLTRANLTDANLTDANLTRANLTRANLTDANLTHANLTHANLTRANLTRANLTRANLTRANLTRANLTDADLRSIRADFFDMLIVVPHEVPGLRAALVEGRIDGSTYSGDCACLMGTIANVRHCSHAEIPGLRPDSERPAERWFLALRPGHTPENSQVAAITLGWIDFFLARVQPTAIAPVPV